MNRYLDGAIPPAAVYIGGRWIETQDTDDVVNPADQSVLAKAPRATPDHAAEALSAAKKGQPAWARHSGVERGAMLSAVADGIRVGREQLARLVSLEQGKTITEARGEIDGTAAFFDYYATFARGRVGTMYAPDGRNEQLIVRNVPYGVVVGITPWNFPAALFARKVAPAIMAGNAIVMKPHSDTPLSALALAAVIEDAGVPAGVVNVVTGDGPVVGDALVRHPVTDLVAVTGSVRAGKEILAAAAPGITSVSLELGGKAPFIVLPDADLRSAIRDAAEARFWNCGQVCTCNERTYVHRSIYEPFVEGLIQHARAIKLGPPLDERNEMGPKINDAEWRKVDAFVRQAQDEGAEVLTGGGRPEGERFQHGYWFSPTVIAVVRNDLKIMQEEVFGPVLPVMSFDDYEEALALANDTPFGLTAYVYTKGLSTAMHAIENLNFGEVYVNKIGPEQVQGFHGGYGLSGMGGDDGEHGFERYHRKKTVYLGLEADDTNTRATFPPQ